MAVPVGVAEISPTNLAQKDGCFDYFRRYFRSSQFRFRVCFVVSFELLALFFDLLQKLRFDSKSLADHLEELI